MANNNNLFNAALGGAATGVASRSITSTDPTFYASQSALIADFATAFDAQIAPIVGGGSRGQSDVVSDICAAFWRDRIITSDADLTAVAAALAALFASLDPSILPDSGGGGGDSIIVASVIQKSTTADPGTVLYTVPVGASGLYRLTNFCGPASVNGNGQVNVIPAWPEFPPFSGNVQFMSPTPAAPELVGITPFCPSSTMTIGEGSSLSGPQTFTWWAQEGGVFTYEVSSSFADGDYVWCMILEKLAGFSNPNP